MTTIEVCIGSACHIKGSYNVISKLQEIINDKKLENQVVIKAAFCLGECTNAVSVRANEGKVQSLDIEGVAEFLDSLLAEGGRK
ncbi:MAG: hypothetical protein K0Q99_610 [Clostridia bacterium]|jgi:NADH:ubiquinone oxidoreductase subunit E|nr:hypothetical protein [Clostridia bacterium]